MVKTDFKLSLKVESLESNQLKINRSGTKLQFLELWYIYWFKNYLNFLLAFRTKNNFDFSVCCFSGQNAFPSISIYSSQSYYFKTIKTIVGTCNIICYLSRNRRIQRPTTFSTDVNFFWNL